jgi:hypothetical protein
MSDHTNPVNLEGMDEDERRDKWRNRVLIALIALIGFAVAGWVGAIVNDNQNDARKAEAGQEQAQVEKFNLAQQIATACADESKKSLDAATYDRLCHDAATIVREGPQGAQGIPGVQGPQGVQGNDGLQGAQGVRGPPGENGKDGTNGTPGADGAQGPQGEQGPAGATGPQGPQGERGETGAVGPQGPAGADGQPPTGWVVFGENDQVIETCKRSDPFDSASPTYTCTRTNGQ